jgi:acylphosphatase/uncharacterized protein YoxC
MRVRLLVKGTVQGVGFRALVKQLGRNLGLKGTIRNLSDGSVEVYCEGTERLIRDFRKKMEYRGDPDRPFSLNVESITLHPEGDAEYANPPEKWEPIDVDYGDALSTFEREMLERTEIGSFLLLETSWGTRRVGKNVESVGKNVESVGEKVESVGDKVESVGDKVESVGEKVESVGDKVESVGGEVRELREAATRGFEDLDKKYHVIAQNLERLNPNIERMADSLALLVRGHVGRETRE